MTKIHCIILTLLIFSLCYYFFKKQAFSIKLPLMLILFLAVYGTLFQISIKKTNELIVYNTPGASTIGIKTGKILNLYSDTSIVSSSVTKQTATLGLKIKMNKLNDDLNCIRSAGKYILICNSLEQVKTVNLKADYLILTGAGPETKNYLSEDKMPGTLIITSEAGAGFHLSGTADHAGIDSIHIVRKSGAFVTPL